MTAEGWIVLLVTCFACVSSNDEQFDYEQPCAEEWREPCRVKVQLGSHALLPCTFSTDSTDTVTWSHKNTRDVVQLSFRSIIRFTDHRYGRVKVFPNQASEGNYSICIDDLAQSDLGSYRCRRGDVCHQVELFIEERWWSQEMSRVLFVCVGVTLFILLLVGAFCCYKTCVGFCKNEAEDRNEPVITVASTVAAQPIGPSLSSDNNFFVYENDDQCPTGTDHTRNHSVPPEALRDPAGPQPGHGSCGIYPNLNQMKFERVKSQRTRKSFHIDLFTRLREASVRRHYYVNQAELNQQQAAAVQADTRHRECEYTNPIYNRSTDRLDRL